MTSFLIFLMMHFVFLSCRQTPTSPTCQKQTRTWIHKHGHESSANASRVRFNQLDTNMSDMFQNRMHVQSVSVAGYVHVQTRTFRARKHLLEIICSKRLGENSLIWSIRAPHSPEGTQQKLRSNRWDGAYHQCSAQQPKQNLSDSILLWELREVMELERSPKSARIQIY